MTQATIASFEIRQATLASPAAYTAIEEVQSLSGFGVNNELVEVTHLTSPSAAKEYIAGLADGAEMTLECNFFDTAAEQAALIASVNARRTLTFQVANTGVSPEVTYDFSAVCIGWEIVPSPTEQNKINFTLKITGAIT